MFIILRFFFHLVFFFFHCRFLFFIFSIVSSFFFVFFCHFFEKSFFSLFSSLSAFSSLDGAVFSPVFCWVLLRLFLLWGGVAVSPSPVWWGGGVPIFFDVV